MNKNILISAFSLLATFLNAQNKIGGQLKMEYVPFSNYIRPIDSLKTDSKSDFKKAELSLKIPLYTKELKNGKVSNWSLLFSTAYARMNNKNYEEQLFPSEMLNSQIGLQYFSPISSSWSILTMASVGIYTDMENISADDILGQGGVLFIKHFNPKLALGLGPVLSNNFGVPMVMPGIYFDWKTGGDKFNVNINFPEGVEAGYQMTTNFALKGVVNLSGMVAERSKEGKSLLVGYQQVVAGLRPEIKLSNSLKLQLTGGTTLVRSFSENERSLKSLFKKKDIADPRFSTTFYSALSLRWNLP